MKKYWIIGFLFLWACTKSPVEPPGEGRIYLDRTSFSVGESVKFRLRNDYGSTLSAFQCNNRINVSVQQLKGTDWVTSANFNSACPAFLISGMVDLNVGEERTDSVTPPVAGTLRLVTEYGSGFSRIGRLAYSDLFTVK